MSDFFTTALKMQADMLRAQKAQIDAAQKLLDMGKTATRMQEAGQKAAEANLAAWKQWSALWGIK